MRASARGLAGGGGGQSTGERRARVQAGAESDVCEQSTRSCQSRDPDYSGHARPLSAS